LTTSEKKDVPKLSPHQWAALLRMKDFNWTFPKNGNKANGLVRSIQSLAKLGLAIWLEPGDTNRYGSKVDGFGWDLTPEGYALARQEFRREHDDPKVYRQLYLLRISSPKSP
jgi:hypothetical protein